MFVSEISSAAQKAITGDIALVSRLASERKRFENWLQLQILSDFIMNDSRLEIEYPYPKGKDRCDFWVCDNDGVEHWIELKLCVTNYCAAFTGQTSSRPITNQISSILVDINKLRRVNPRNIRSIVLLAYPLPLEATTQQAWAKHLTVIAGKCSIIDHHLQIRLTHEGREASINGYIIRV